MLQLVERERLILLGDADLIPDGLGAALFVAGDHLLADHLRRLAADLLNPGVQCAVGG